MTQGMLDAVTSYGEATTDVSVTVGVFDWSSSVTYVLTHWTFLTILYSTGSGNEAM